MLVTGVAVPPGLARLETFAASAVPYPAGYVIAAVRVMHWVKRLRALGGPTWWRSSAVQADIRAHIQAGGTVRFPKAWWDPAPFLNVYLPSGEFPRFGARE